MGPQPLLFSLDRRPKVYWRGRTGPEKLLADEQFAVICQWPKKCVEKLGGLISADRSQKDWRLYKVPNK